MGVIFDLVKMEMSVPEDKKAKALHAIEQAAGNSFVFVGAVQRLLGILVFIGRVLLSGMWHLSRSVMALRVAARNGYVKMSADWNEELQWWVELLNHWNCKALMVPERWIAPTYDSVFFTDASRSEAKLVGGAGGIFHNLVFQFDFNADEIRGMEIADLEGITHLLFLHELCLLCPEELAGRRFITRCDNQNFCDAVNRKKPGTPSMAFLVGEMHKLMALFNFDVRIDFVKSKDNEMADAFSRRAWARVLNFLRTHQVQSRFTKSDVKGMEGVCEGWEKFVAAATDTLTLSPLVWIHIQDERRSKTASSVIRRRQWARSMLRERLPVGGQD